MLPEPGYARAVAHSNIALAKYWGKSDLRYNLPAVPSVSLTLDALVTDTEVRFDEALDRDALVLDGTPAGPRELGRVTALLDRVRTRAGTEARAVVRSQNRFPTAAGLASSASGFAALAAAATEAAGIDLALSEVSALARQSSASAARSVFGGFVELDAGAPGEDTLAARPVASEDHWDVRLVVALTARGPKSVSSTEAMERSRMTSPYYEAWVQHAPSWCEDIKRAVGERDLPALGEAMEQSTLAFHCSAITSRPSTLYWGPGTMAALHTVAGLRESGVPVWSTMDAGPHVKALCEAADAARVQDALDATPGVVRTLVAAPGPGVTVTS